MTLGVAYVKNYTHGYNAQYLFMKYIDFKTKIIVECQLQAGWTGGGLVAFAFLF